MMHFNHDLRGVLYKKDGGMFYNKERHICRYNENGIGEEELYYYFLCRSGRFYFSKYESELTNLLKLSDNSRCYAVNEYIQYKCPKYQYYITALECIKKTMFAKLPKNINTYLNDKIYLGIYDELLYAFNGKMFKIIEQIAKHPCYYTDNNLSSYGLYGLQCKKPLKNRQFQYINLYIYNKDGKITGNIKIRRADK